MSHLRTKKADMAEHPVEASNHVGLLVNEPLAQPSCSLPSLPTTETYYFSIRPKVQARAATNPAHSAGLHPRPLPQFLVQALSRMPAGRNPGQGEDYDLFSSHCAYVVVQAYNLYSRDLLDHRLKKRIGRFDQIGPY